MNDAGSQQRLAIAAVSDLLEIPIPTIRSWERRYGFPAPARTSGRHRRYSMAEVAQLRALRDAITHGHSARDAVELVRGGGVVPAERDRRIDQLLRGAIDLDPNALRGLLQDATEELGVEAAVTDVALPALHEVGARWKAGTCDVASEHLLTDAIRAWIARLTTLTPTSPGSRPVVLSCGPKELHSVGLEAFGLLLRRRGLPVLMLGALTPAESLKKAVIESGAAAAVVVAQRSVNRKSTLESIEAIRPLLVHGLFYAGGAFASAGSRRHVPAVYLGTDLVRAAAEVDAGTSVAGRSARSRIGAG